MNYSRKTPPTEVRSGVSCSITAKRTAYSRHFRHALRRDFREREVFRALILSAGLEPGKFASEPAVVPFAVEIDPMEDYIVFRIYGVQDAVAGATAHCRARNTETAAFNSGASGIAGGDRIWIYCDLPVRTVPIWALGHFH